MNSKKFSRKFFGFLVSILLLLALDLVLVAVISFSGTETIPMASWVAALCILICLEAFALVLLWCEFRQQTHHFSKIESELKSCLSANASKSLFLANTSHEIRTPLSAILGFSKLLQDPSLSPQERENYGTIIRKTGDSLLSIVNDILDLSKAEAGQVEVSKEDFLLRPLLEEVANMCLARHSDIAIVLKISIGEGVDQQVYTDRQRLQQILLNVVGNAYKFTSRGEIILGVQQNDSEYSFTIKDSGRGIPPDQQSLLFQNFSRIPSSDLSPVEGTGLGLALSRNLARLLGGDLSLIASKPGRGSEFLLVLPRLPVKRAEEDSSTSDCLQGNLPDDFGLSGKRILLVEDSEINQLMMERFLSRRGLQVEIAINGEEALRLASHNYYDAVLMDVQLPILDGLAATRELRRNGYDRPIIALTAHAMKQDRDRCLEAGYDDYLSKPVQFEQLFSVLARRINDRPLRRPLLDIHSGQN